MKLIYALIALALLSLVNSANIPDDDKIAQAGDLGKIRGFEVLTRNTKRPFLQFLGIPYGDSSRFGPSKVREGPLTPNDGIYEANKFGASCPQPGSGIESCFYLNIATHNVKNTTNLRPVILFIHGAAFIGGNANAYTGELLLKRDVVVVSFNYRLGVFGFFCFNTADVPCNAALYDAITALQWVRKYIRFFGGDPNSVTLAGQSSGSASVSHILLSPLAKGLFHRAIMLSGTAINEWALASDPMTSSLRVAELSGCYVPSVPGNSPDLAVIGTCMINTANQTVIIDAQEEYQEEERKAGRLGFAAVNPAVQNEIGLGDIPVILPDNPLKIINRGEQMNVPLLLGATKHDGAFGVLMLLAFYLIPNGNLQFDSNFLKYGLVPTMLSSLGIEDDSGGLYEIVARTYLGETRLSGNFSIMLPGLIDMASVFYFKAGAYKMAQLHSRINSTYFYSFDFSGTKTNHNPLLPFPGIVAHADDLIYVFPTFDFKFDAREQIMSDALIDYWVNYATTGEPGLYPNGSSGDVITWPKLTETNPEYLIIHDDIRVDDDYPGSWTTTSTPPITNDPTTSDTTIPNTSPLTGGGAVILQSTVWMLGLTFCIKMYTMM